MSGETQFLGEQLDRRWGQQTAAPRRAVGLGHHADDRVMLCQGLQGWQGKFGRAHENNAGMHGRILAQEKEA